MSNTCIGRASGNPKARVPWADLESNLSEFISPDILPNDFAICDPSHMTRQNVRNLLSYWKDRQRDAEVNHVLRFRRYLKSRDADGQMVMLPADYEQRRPAGKEKRKRSGSKKSKKRPSAAGKDDAVSDSDVGGKRPEKGRRTRKAESRRSNKAARKSSRSTDDGEESSGDPEPYSNAEFEDEGFSGEDSLMHRDPENVSTECPSHARGSADQRLFLISLSGDQVYRYCVEVVNKYTVRQVLSVKYMAYGIPERSSFQIPSAQGDSMGNLEMASGIPSGSRALFPQRPRSSIGVATEWPVLAGR